MNNETVSLLTVPVNSQDHMQGKHSAPVILVQYGNYQCPYCGALYPILQNLLQQFGEQLCFVFRHFPFSPMFPHAQHAAEAAEAAAAQGKFWDMHDCLLTHQHALGNGYLVEYAIALNLDIPQFLREITADVYVQPILEDFESGRQSGVLETPAFFINNHRYGGPWNEPSLLKAISDAMP